MTSTKMGVVSMKNGDVEIKLEAGFNAAVKIHAVFKKDIFVWIQEKMTDEDGMPSRMGITEVFHNLQTEDSTLTMEEVWDNFTGNLELFTNEEHMKEVFETIGQVCGKKFQDMLAAIPPSEDEATEDEKKVQSA